jgi:hypothetical protein
VSSSITGTAVTRAGGGGGAGSPSVGGDGGSGGGGNGASMGQPFSGPERNATAGQVNTGSGGGGGGSYQNFSNAAAGGSGVVIVRYPDNYQLNADVGLTHSTTNLSGFNITTFTAGTGNVVFTEIPTEPYAYELLETVTLGGSQASVTFSNLSATYGNDYQHLQLRMVVRGERAGLDRDVPFIQLNGDTGANYRAHGVVGAGNTAFAGVAGNTSNIDLYSYIQASTSPTGAYSAYVVDFLDPFETTKNKVIRSLSCGTVRNSESGVALSSGVWLNTSALTSIRFYAASANLSAGSRFSLYGIKAT